MDGTQTFNINAAECLREAHHLGHTAVHNVCSGSVTDVPWGLGDWMANVGLGAAMTFIVLVCAGIIGGLFIAMWRDR